MARGDTSGLRLTTPARHDLNGQGDSVSQGHPRRKSAFAPQFDNVVYIDLKRTESNQARAEMDL